jgi:hypothetical protein
MTAETAATLSTALLLAAAGWRCFPCASNKRPATPHGFKDAADDPATLHALWYQYPAPLIGVATGAASGRDVLDLDRKHPEAHQWWAEHRAYLPRTRTHRTRSGGLHLIFRHQPGVGIWAGRPVPGVDGRGDRGFAIWWPAAGLRVLSDAPPAPWPEWLLDELSPPGPAAPSAVWTSSSDASRYRTGSRYTSAALQNAAERVAGLR